jgi:hypothetical protein
MKLHEILAINSEPTKSVLYELCLPYLKMLKKYHDSMFNEQTILMVTSVSNAAQYVKIIPASEFSQCVYDFMGVDYVVEDKDEEEFDEDIFAEYETICFNSKIL